jgi:membrane-bound lytic murein transglycosylase D
MISWKPGLILLCLLFIGCGGGQVAVAPPPVESPDSGQEVVTDDPGESLAEQLSAKRLEELCSKSGLQGVDPILEEELKKWDQALKFDVPIDMNKQVKAYLVYFTTERKGTIRKYLSRSTRYLPMIREVFQEHGLPEDLAYLAMIESGFNPHAYSHAAACGMWQFIRGTGVRYGLAVNNYVDERRDPEKATHAAAKYLLDLYKQFGSWYLAAASYNCGEGRVQREINASSHKNFWDLSDNKCLPTETKNYVPQMIAATIIAKNPEKFGFKNVPYLPPLQFDTVKVDEPTSLRAASVACNVPPEELQLLNPELRRGVTPAEMPHYTLKIPKGAKELFTRNIQLARIEVPAQASAPVREDRGTPRRSVVRKGTASRKVVSTASTSQSPKKSSGKVTNGQKKPEIQTASVKKGKTGGGVQEASVLGAGKSSGARKSSGTATGSKSASKDKAKTTKSSGTAKKATNGNGSKKSKKKAS